MSELTFDKVFDLLNIYLRDASKNWSAKVKSERTNEIKQLLANSFHIIKTAALLFQPITPVNCEMIREYLFIDERIWDFRYIFEPIRFFAKSSHRFKFFELRVDFSKSISLNFTNQEMHRRRYFV